MEVVNELFPLQDDDESTEADLGLQMETVPYMSDVCSISFDHSYQQTLPDLDIKTENRETTQSAPVISPRLVKKDKHYPALAPLLADEFQRKRVSSWILAPLSILR